MKRTETGIGGEFVAFFGLGFISAGALFFTMASLSVPCHRPLLPPAIGIMQAGISMFGIAACMRSLFQGKSGPALAMALLAIFSGTGFAVTL